MYLVCYICTCYVSVHSVIICVWYIGLYLFVCDVPVCVVYVHMCVCAIFLQSLLLWLDADCPVLFLLHPVALADSLPERYKVPVTSIFKSH